MAGLRSCVKQFIAALPEWKQRSMHVQKRIEQHAERPEGLTSPLGSEAEQYDVTRIQRHIESRGLASQVILSDQVTRAQWRTRIGITRQHCTNESLLDLEHRTAVNKDRRLSRHPRHDRVREIDGGGNDGAAQEEFLRAETAHTVCYG